MKILLSFAFIVSSWMATAQITEGLCEILSDVEQFSIAGKLDTLKSKYKNEDGSYEITRIPARFAESAFRSLSDNEYSIQYSAYGKAKDITKLKNLVLEEAKLCYPDYIMEESEHNTDKYQKYFFCHPSETGGSEIIPTYNKFAFKIVVQYREKDQSQVTLTVQ